MPIPEQSNPLSNDDSTSSTTSSVVDEQKMANRIRLNSLLVPTDFSANAWAAFQQALRMVDGDESEIIVVHVIDPAYIDQSVQLGISDHDTMLQAIRDNADKQLKKYRDESSESINIDLLVCEGEPYFEIIKKADDFAVDAIVMSKLGQRSPAHSLMFGSTAEKVTRGSKKPVIVLPSA